LGFYSISYYLQERQLKTSFALHFFIPISLALCLSIYLSAYQFQETELVQAKDREKMALLQQQLGEKEQQIQEETELVQAKDREITLLQQQLGEKEQQMKQTVSVAVELCVVTRGPPDCRRLS
jgi:hypothetical protein